MLAIVTVPVGVWLFAGAFDRTADIAPLVIARIVLGTVLAPLAAGIALRAWLPAVAEKIARPAGIVGMLLLVVGVLLLVYASWGAIRAVFGNGTVTIVAAMAAIGLVVGHLLGGPEPDNRTVLALSTAARHPAIALAAAVAGGAETKPELAAILLYLIVAAIVSIPYVVWRRRASAAARASGMPARNTMK